MLVLLSLIIAFAKAIEISLPGSPIVSFKQYSGYFDVGTNHYVHYYFAESQNRPDSDPVLISLSGGAGCSGFLSLFTEWGPLLVNNDGTTLTLNPYGFNRNASILVLEAPAGVGYSYVDDADLSYYDEKVARENWEAVKAFFTEFPQFASNDLYVTGSNYGGIQVPTLVQEILDRQANFSINIKGIAIGNGCVSWSEGADALVQFAYNHGLVDDTKWEEIKANCCAGAIDDCAFHDMLGFDTCGLFVDSINTLVWGTGINPYNMYHDCTPVPPEAPKKNIVCVNESAVNVYLNRQDVRAALQVPANLPRWQTCNLNVSGEYEHTSPETAINFQNALNAGLRVLLYYGDVDLACPYLMGERFSRKLGFARTLAKRAFNLDGQVVGYHTKYGKLDFVTIRGAGMMAAADKPNVAFHVLDAFLNNRNP